MTDRTLALVAVSVSLTVALVGTLVERNAALAERHETIQELVSRVRSLEDQVRSLDEQLKLYKEREGSQRKVLLIAGMDSSLTSSVDVFSDVLAALLREGFKTQDVFHFSFAGGLLNGLGEYKPDEYECASLRLGMEPARDRLRKLLSAYQHERPDVRWTIVGHSFGGLLAFESLRDQALPVRQVIAIDAPLHGVSTAKSLWARLLPPCDGSTFSRIPDDLELRGRDPRSRQANSVVVVEARARGVSVVTVGNLNDCLYNPGPCLSLRCSQGTSRAGLDAFLCSLLSVFGLADETRTQVVDEADYAALWSLGTGGDFLDSHWLALRRAEAVAFLVSMVRAAD